MIEQMLDKHSQFETFIDSSDTRCLSIDAFHRITMSFLRPIECDFLSLVHMRNSRRSALPEPLPVYVQESLDILDTVLWDLEGKIDFIYSYLPSGVSDEVEHALPSLVMDSDSRVLGTDSSLDEIFSAQTSALQCDSVESARGDHEVEQAFTGATIVLGYHLVLQMCFSPVRSAIIVRKCWLVLVKVVPPMSAST